MGKLLPFSMNYIFVCKNCNITKLESYRRTQASIPQMCITALANLIQASIKEDKKKIMFNKDKEILPFIDNYWESMTTLPRKTTLTWFTTIHKNLASNTTIFVSEETADGICFGLKSPDLLWIKPDYENTVKGGNPNDNTGE